MAYGWPPACIQGYRTWKVGLTFAGHRLSPSQTSPPEDWPTRKATASRSGPPKSDITSHGKSALPYSLVTEGASALARGFQTPKQQRQQRIDPRRSARLAPFLGMGGMMEAAGGIENGARRTLDVGDLERALLYAVGQDLGNLIDQAVLMTVHRLAGLTRQRQVSGKHLGIVAEPLVLDRKHRAQPLIQPRWRRAGSPRDLQEGRAEAVEPALGHCLAQRGLAGKMAIDAAMADIERTGNVHHGCLGQPVTA